MNSEQPHPPDSPEDIVVSVAGLVFGEDAVRGELFAQLQGLMGADAAEAVQDLLASVNEPSKGILGTLAGVALLVFGATTGARLPVRPAMIPVFIHLGLVLMLGLWIPPFLADWYRQAARLIG